MPAAEVNKIVTPREQNDCALVALSIYLGVSYEDVLREAAAVDPKNQGREGLKVKQIKAVAERLGTPLRLRRKFDRNEDYGMLLTPDHVFVIRNGLAFEPDPGTVTVWEVDDYLAHWRTQPTGLLVEDNR